MMANGSRFVHHLQNLVVFHKLYEWDILHKDEPLSIKASNDLGLNEFVCIVGTKCDIMCNDTFTTNCNHHI